MADIWREMVTSVRYNMSQDQNPSPGSSQAVVRVYWGAGLGGRASPLSCPVGVWVRDCALPPACGCGWVGVGPAPKDKWGFHSGRGFSRRGGSTPEGRR